MEVWIHVFLSNAVAESVWLVFRPSCFIRTPLSTEQVAGCGPQQTLTFRRIPSLFRESNHHPSVIQPVD